MPLLSWLPCRMSGSRANLRNRCPKAGSKEETWVLVWTRQLTFWMILQSHPVFLLLLGGHGNFQWKIFKFWHFQFYRIETEYPKGWEGIPGGFLGDSRRWSGLGRAHWLFLRLHKMVVWVSCVGLCLLLPFWGMNLFEEWVRATDHFCRKASSVHRTIYHTYVLFYV